MHIFRRQILNVYPTLTTTRPRTWPDRISGATPNTSESANFSRHHGQFLAVQIGFQAFPGFPPSLNGTHHGVDAVKTHTPQNERGNRSRQVHTTGKAARGYRSAIARHRQQVAKRVGTHGIDRASPALLRQRLGRSCKLLAVDDFGRTQPLQVIGLLRPARDRMNHKAALGENRDRNRTDAAGRACHRDRPA